jgi:hypothetical protein|tara:strand:- start:761 stop:898 length:138 start_codon:yes stop_codon:yes gene_type:complete
MATRFRLPVLPKVMIVILLIHWMAHFRILGMTKKWSPNRKPRIRA